MKLYTRTITLTFTVEHVSDDPRYEERLSDTITAVTKDIREAASNAFCSLIARRELHYPITAGGWGVVASEPTPACKRREKCTLYPNNDHDPTLCPGCNDDELDHCVGWSHT